MRSHLPPVFKEVFPKYILGRVFVVKHFGEERCHFLGRLTQLHGLPCRNGIKGCLEGCSEGLECKKTHKHTQLTIIIKPNILWNSLIGRSEDGTFMLEEPPF